jgi:hypothetical protein
MNNFELAVKLKDMVAGKAAEIYTYINWEDGFALSEIRGYPDKIKSMDGFFKINPNELTVAEAETLGFNKWDEGSDLLLIPLWLLPFLVDEFMAGSISNDEHGIIKTSEIDNDQRFGCLATGVYLEH